MSDFLTRDAFLQTREKRRKTVECPELGVGAKVLVQAPSAYERGQLEAWLHNKQGGTRVERMARIRERIAILCCVTEDGSKLFSEADVDLLGQTPASVLERIMRAYQEMSMTDDEDLATLEGNSPATRA